MAIAEETERWILTLNQAAVEEETARKAPPEISEAEREEALEFLRRRDLTDAILADMEALGYVGEEQGKLLAYLIGISRKLDRPLAGVIISQSGAGKSSLTELIEVLTPPEEVVAYARISTQALMYEEKDFLEAQIIDSRGASRCGAGRLLDTGPAVQAEAVSGLGDKKSQHGADVHEALRGRGPGFVSGNDDQPENQLRERDALLRAFRSTSPSIRRSAFTPPARGAHAARSAAADADRRYPPAPPQCAAPAAERPRGDSLRGAVVVPESLAADAARQRAVSLPHRGGGVPAPVQPSPPRHDAGGPGADLYRGHAG